MFCQGTKKDGTPCKGQAVRNGTLCNVHATDRTNQARPGHGFWKRPEFLNFLLVLATLASPWVAWRIADQSLNLSKKQLALQLRPFIAVLNPSFSFHPDREGHRNWLRVNYSVYNFGEQPAHEYVRKNDKVMVISLPAVLLDTAAKTAGDPTRTVTERDVAFQSLLDARVEITSQLYSYLRQHPMATRQEINEQFASQGVHCYGDITELFPPPTMLLPKEAKPAGSGRDVGSNYGQGLAEGKEVLVYYVYLMYEGALPNESFSTFYMGYYDDNLRRIFKGEISPEGVNGIALTEYRQWMDRQGL